MASSFKSITLFDGIPSFRSTYLQQSIKLRSLPTETPQPFSQSQSNHNHDDDTTETKDCDQINKRNWWELLLQAPQNDEYESDDDVNVVINSRDREKDVHERSKKGLQLAIDEGVSDLRGYFSGKKPDEINKILDMERLKAADIDSKTIFKQGTLAQRRIGPARVNKRLEQKIKRGKKRATSGKNWYHVPRAELTEEVQKDLVTLKMRSTLDPARHYRKDDKGKELPRYFHVGRVVETAADFYSGRIPKKDRKQTLVEELMSDARIKKSIKSRIAKREAVTKQMRMRKRRIQQTKKQKDGKSPKVKGKKGKGLKKSNAKGGHGKTKVKAKGKTRG